MWWLWFIVFYSKCNAFWSIHLLLTDSLNVWIEHLRWWSRGCVPCCYCSAWLPSAPWASSESTSPRNKNKWWIKKHCVTQKHHLITQITQVLNLSQKKAHSRKSHVNVDSLSKCGCRVRSFSAPPVKHWPLESVSPRPSAFWHPALSAEELRLDTPG